MTEWKRDERDSTEVMTKATGIFWGIVLIILGLFMVVVYMEWIEFKLELVFSLLIVVVGLWLIVSKLAR
jgi:ABC-type nickel/cobalt efflux system permease component RcnA